MKIANFTLTLFCIGICSLADAQSLKITQVKDSAYEVSVTSNKRTLSWNTKPDSWKDAKPLVLKSNHETLVLASVHPILKFDESKKKSVYEAPRGITLQGAVNFRDIGGYMAKDGRQVKWGKIYRSADVSKLTDADLAKLATLNIKMVCDLRGPVEVGDAPDRLPPGAEWLNLPAGSEQTGSANSYMKYMKNPESADSMMTAFYTKNDHYKDKYKPMFDQLLTLEDDRALMFHCSAGKDRTGVGAALILYALGVSEADILQDYEATNEYRKGTNEAFIKKFVSQGISEKAAQAMMAANPKYLKASFASLTEKYGSINNFMETQLGLTPEKRSLLQSKLLY